MTKSQVKTYNLMDLHALKAHVKTDSLYFLTQVWRNLKTFDPLNIHDPIDVWNIEGKIKFIRNGIQRAIWYVINNQHTMRAVEYYTEQTEKDPPIERVVEVVTKESKSRFSNPYELAARVENPSDYYEEGEPSIRITLNDLITGKRFKIPA